MMGAAEIFSHPASSDVCQERGSGDATQHPPPPSPPPLPGRLAIQRGRRMVLNLQWFSAPQTKNNFVIASVSQVAVRYLYEG